MKTIVEGRSDVKKILGKQRLKETTYRLMKYTLHTRCEQGVLLHNVITGHLVLLNTEESAILGELPIARTINMTSLIESFFLVPNDCDEKAIVDNLRVIMQRLFTPKGINGYTIMTTTNCNARCFYCYQSNYPHINMSMETVDTLVDYMVKHKGEDPLRIQWFGGEPLVGIAVIERVSDELRKRGIEFTSSMISNGYLFTDAIVEKAVKCWNLKNIQITLDGTEEVYNSTKAYVSADISPFKRVLRNINALLEHGVHVGIRLNLDQHNEEDLFQLVSIIAELVPQTKFLNVSSHVVYENEGYAPIERTERKRDELYRTQSRINKKIVEKGLSRIDLSLPFIKYRSCMADNPRSMVVFPDGRLFKCEHTAEGEHYGHISYSEMNEEMIAKYTVPSNRESCQFCNLYPSCLILKACYGLKDRNPTTCGFDVEKNTQALLYQYQRFLSKEESLNLCRE